MRYDTQPHPKVAVAFLHSCPFRHVVSISFSSYKSLTPLRHNSKVKPSLKQARHFVYPGRRRPMASSWEFRATSPPPGTPWKRQTRNRDEVVVTVCPHHAIPNITSPPPRRPCPQRSNKPSFPRSSRPGNPPPRPTKTLARPRPTLPIRLRKLHWRHALHDLHPQWPGQRRHPRMARRRPPHRLPNHHPPGNETLRRHSLRRKLARGHLLRPALRPDARVPRPLPRRHGRRPPARRRSHRSVGDGGVLSALLAVLVESDGPGDEGEGEGCHAADFHPELELAGV